MELDLLPGGGPLRAQVRAFLAPWASPEEGYDPALWAALGATGWLAPARLADLAVVLEELGRAGAPTPVQNGVVQVLAAAPMDGVADARVRAALCVCGPGGAVAPGALGAVCRLEAGVAVVDGVKAYVAHAATADVLVVAADGPGAGASLVQLPASAPGVGIEVRPSVAGDRQATVTFSGARGRVIGEPGGAWERVARAVLVGTAGLCAEAVGASAALIERSVDHVTTRVQFGGPIGRFQAVQHRMADMAIDHLAAFGAVEEAFAALDAGRPAGAEVAAAKALCATALARVAASAHQVCGGTGYLAESGLHRWTRLIAGAAAQFGGGHSQRLAVVAALDGTAGWSTHDLG
ncbi:MAG TPA: acyl-CoA dehydrogenase [Acidimicrobiales bacterium]|nr:acyl-CoA dehydrogenase [Acidimicrobiales bacterium]